MAAVAKETLNASAQPGETSAGASPQPDHRSDVVKRPRKPNYNQIHSCPLPLDCHPLPAFIPHNPLSLLRIAYVYISQWIWRPSSHPSKACRGVFNTETQSVNVIESASVRLLWERGFFGKGSLSRSEPTWLEREKKRRGLAATKTSEEVTMSRREERKLFKLERALKEREAIKAQRILETQGETGPQSFLQDSTSSVAEGTLKASEDQSPAEDSDPNHKTARRPTPPDESLQLRGEDEAPHVHEDINAPPEDDIHEEEHLQLSLEEAFYLTYGLGALEISHSTTECEPHNTQQLLALFCKSSCATNGSSPYSSDNPFLTKYVVYHHFRSLGWVVRPGSKFSADYLLYNRGPVFSHAEFAVIILPSYSDPYWFIDPERNAKATANSRREWWWLHLINRVQNHVHKTLVIVYVDIPPISDVSLISVGALLKQYKVREFIVRRWAANRNRD